MPPVDYYRREFKPLQIIYYGARIGYIQDITKIGRLKIILIHDLNNWRKPNVINTPHYSFISKTVKPDKCILIHENKDKEDPWMLMRELTGITQYIRWEA